MQKTKGAAKKPKSKARIITSYVVVVLLAIATGALAGLFYVNNFINVTNYNNYSEEGLRDDESEIFSKYSSASVASLSGINAFIVAEHKLANMGVVTLNATGNIDAMGVKQDLYTKKYKNNNSYFVENISKGRVVLGIDTNIAERNYYNPATDMVSVYKGTNIQQTSATFASVSEELTLSAWKEKNGTTPLSFQPYIVSTKTVIEATNPTSCRLDNGSMGYCIKMSLKSTAAFLYVKQIKNLSGLGDYPDFLYINLEVYLNQDGSFNKIICSEKYNVKKVGMKVGTASSMIYNFSYEPEEIPTI